MFLNLRFGMVGIYNLLYKGWERRCRLYLELKPGGMDEGEKNPRVRNDGIKYLLYWGTPVD